MLKNIFILFIACVAFVNWSYSQHAADEKFLLNEIPKEQVYLHLNSTLLFSGEKLLYKFYSLNSDSDKLSDLSKIGWVILLNSDKEEIFQHKLKLKEGQGNSDFFIPSNLPSGAYKLLGYTSWMQNAKENYFEQEINILNPFQNENKGLILKENSVGKKENLETGATSDFQLNLNKDSFSKREEVIISLDNSIRNWGDFSVSVRRIDDFSKPYRIRTTNYKDIYENIRWDFSDTVIMPEVRGSLITGKVTGKNNSTVNSNSLVISFPGEQNQLNIVSLGENGSFNFTVQDGITADEVLLQLSDTTDINYTIDLQQSVQPDFSSLIFNKPAIYKGFKEIILEKSVNNQIENAYSATKADRTIFPKDYGYFFDGRLIKYKLDDYTRFTDVTQTFVEIIKYGRVRRNSNGKSSILVRNENPNGEFTLPALLIVDGVVVQDHEKLISFDTERIKSIGLLRSKFYFGPEIFQGVVVVETIEGDFPEAFKEDYVISAKVIPAQNPKIYYSPNYQTTELERIPDYRYQLLWAPTLKLNKREDKIKFYTSDLEGKFEINLEGFTNDGDPVSINKIFTVE